MRCIIWNCPNAVMRIRKNIDGLDDQMSDKYRIIWVSIFSSKTREMGSPL